MRLSDEEFRALVDLLIWIDPWSYGRSSQSILEGLADSEAKKRNFDNWIVAFHEFKI